LLAVVSRRNWALPGASVLAGAGIAVSAVTLWIHRGLAVTGGQYTSFCTIDETVNCDVVLSSSYAYLLGLPVAAWGLAAYALVGGLAFAAWRAERFTKRLQVSLAAFLLASACALFSLYLAAIAIFVLRAVCLLCTALYIVTGGLVAATWLGYRHLRAECLGPGLSRVRFAGRTRLVLGGVGLWLTAVLAAVGYEVLGSRGTPDTLSEIAEREPGFYRWYMQQPLQSIPADGGQFKGSERAPVTIVEFSDFECGHCAKAYRVLKEIFPRYRSQIRLVFRHFPLDSSCNSSVQRPLHRYGCAAAIAAECAAEQGRFWEYHDMLFENQARLDPASLLAYAQELRLDMGRFQACMKSDAARSRVLRDVAEGMRLGIDSTPTFFVNGRTIRGQLPRKEFQYAIAIERAKSASIPGT